MKTVVFEGLDKSGKSTLMAALNKLTNYKYTCIDRAWISQFVYGTLRRAEPLDTPTGAVQEGIEAFSDSLDMIGLLNEFPANSLFIVHVTADHNIIAQRIKESGHEPIAYEASTLFKYSIGIIYKYCPDVCIIKIDTSKNTVAESAQIIADTIFEYSLRKGE